MEKQLNYNLILSLQQLALRRIAVALYSDPHIFSLMPGKQFQPSACYESICDNVKKYRTLIWYQVADFKMRNLQLPEPLTKQLIPLLKAVGSELFIWKLIHEEYLIFKWEPIYVENLKNSSNIQRVCLQRLCWTSAGCVDYKKTAEKLVHCELVGILERFKLACLYCLEDDISVLWEKLPLESKKSFFRIDPLVDPETPNVQSFMLSILEMLFGFVPITTFLRNSLEEYTLYMTKALVEYCFRKMSKKDRDLSIVRTAKKFIKCRNDKFFIDFDHQRGKLSDVVCYLLSLMTREEQIIIFKKLPCEVLGCFLDWPWQDLFMDIAETILTFLPESKYKDLVRLMSKRIRVSCYYSLSFYQNLFLHCPTELRKRFVEKEIQKGYFFLYFLKNGDTETIKLVLRNVDAASRVRLVSSKHGLKLIYHFVHQWHLVKDVLLAAMLSKEDKNRLKEDFSVLLKRKIPIKSEREKYRCFFEFMEDTGARAENKRNLEAEELTETKRLCWEMENDSVIEM